MSRWVEVVIPFRYRSNDPLRRANLQATVQWWRRSPWGWCELVDDGRSGDEQFNRSAAYNKAVEAFGVDVYVFTEADMLIPYAQIERAIEMAAESPGLVVPFTEYHYLSPMSSEGVRAGLLPCEVGTAERVMKNGSSIGAVNVVSRETLELVGGYTEKTEGNWYDDNIMAHAFEHCAGETRWVDGPAYHLYHLPGWKGDHLTDEDRAATERNKQLWHEVRRLTDPAEIRTALHG